MFSKLCEFLVVLFFVMAYGAAQQTARVSDGPAERIALSVPAGAPLRVYLTKRLSKRLDEPVEAKLIDPLFAFDRQVAPAGSKVLGTVV